MALALPFSSMAQEPADLGAVLASPKTWQSSLLPGDWRPVGTNAQGRTLQMSGSAMVFGTAPEQVQAYFDGEKLAELNVTYLEAGNFFGSHEARDAGLKKSQKEFEAKFKSLEAGLIRELSSLYGTGQRRNVGKSQLLRSRVADFAAGGLVVRLFAEENQLIAISVLPAQEEASKKLLSVPDGQAGLVGRRLDIQANVARLANGDIVIQNLPVVEQGERGYCAIGTLTMLTRYYGLPVNVDLVAAKAGYKEGDAANADLGAVYSACAKEAKLKLKVDRSFDFRKAKKFLLKGEPVIVGRKFDRVRDEFHTQFARQFEKDPSIRLPKPDRGERARWPASSAASHASVITGFNDTRDEVIFSESWGEAARNRRMSAAEMEATAFEIDYFTP